MTETLEWWKARAVRRNKEREAAEQHATEAEAKLAKVRAQVEVWRNFVKTHQDNAWHPCTPRCRA